MLKTKVENGQLYAKDSEGYWRRAVWLECTYCGKKFAKLVKRLNRNDRKSNNHYCSVKCGQSEAHKARRRSSRAWFKCPICGYRKLVSNSQAKNMGSCGTPSCKREARSRSMKRIMQQRYPERHYLTCMYCHKKIRISPSELSRRKTCGSPECMKKLHSDQSEIMNRRKREKRLQ